MTIRNLEGLFQPTSLAVVGPNTIGPAALELLLARLVAGGFAGPMTVVGCGKTVPEGFRPKRRLSDLIAKAGAAPDLLIYIGSADDAATVIAEAGAAGTRAVIALSAGYDPWPEAVVARTLQAAQPHLVRVLGPGSLGIAVPGRHLSAHLGATNARAGDLAFIARSGTVVNAMLSWAGTNAVGFSAVASLGQRTDIDISDLLDWFTGDVRTRAILVHLESVVNPRKFLSAARAASRAKPVVVLRSGKSWEDRVRGTTHAGRLAAPDAVFEAALKRAGVLRVDDFDEMFEAVDSISRLRPVAGRRLAIVSSGGSLATVAADRLRQRGGTLAHLSEETLGAVAPIARAGAAVANPVTLSEKAGPDGYEMAVKTMLADKNADAVLAVAAPSAFVPLEATAASIARAYQADKSRIGRKKALLVAFAGGATGARAALDAVRVPCFASSAEAIRSFLHLAHYTEAQHRLMAAPPSLPSAFSPDVGAARAIVRAALARGQVWLGPEEVGDVLAAYQIQRVKTLVARNPAEAADMAATLLADHGQLALKITSPQLPFKSDVGGVLLGLSSAADVRAAAEGLIDRLAVLHPQAEISGIQLQPMLGHRDATELFLGLADDPAFGPAILFGHGGTAVEVMADVALELPPLDLNLADALVRSTSVHKLLAGFRSRPRADIEAVALTLVKISQIAIDIPEIREMDINPLVADASGVIALDARISVAEPALHRGRSATSRLAIAPYPKEWEQTLTLKDGSTVFVRPVRPEDENLYRAFFETVSPEDLRLRFFAPVKDFSHAFMARLVQLDYSRAMAFAATDPESGTILGVVRLHADPDHRTGEYAILVQSGLKGRGLGWALMQLIIRYAAADGIETIKGEVLKENTTMLAMCEALGFQIRASQEDESIAEVVLEVAAAEAAEIED